MTGWTDGFAELEFADKGQQIGNSGPDLLTTDACASIEDMKLVGMTEPSSSVSSST